MSPEQKILGALADKQAGMSSAEIGKTTGLSTATLYPALMALEHNGKVISEWEEGGYPRRRIYRL